MRRKNIPVGAIPTLLFSLALSLVLSLALGIEVTTLPEGLHHESDSPPNESLISQGERFEDKAVEGEFECTKGTVRMTGLLANDEFGAWEVHTTGFGRKMLERYGFKVGMGLGKEGTGVVVPILA